ncbi:MAG: leucine-rich repeat protein [Oscillospiraceae bacterium]|nr:leucine-rich repeat protein [Oscillospiraceae bacterium]
MTKKLFIIILTLCLAITAMTVMVMANESDFTCVYSGEGVTITGYVGSDANVTIPSQITGYDVVAIGDYAFSFNDGITSVTIPDTVKTIGEGAFQNCGQLASVTFPDGLKEIDAMAFLSTQITSVTLSCGTTYDSSSFPTKCTIIQPDHTYSSGVCSVCGASEPDYITIGSLKLYDGYYTTNGSAEIAGKPDSTVASYAYFSNGTLTLCGYGGTSAITYGDDLAIVLEGTNSLTIAGDCGIEVTGALSLSGTGSLTMNVQNINTAYGIYADSVNVSGGAEVSVTVSGYSTCAIMCDEITITSSKVTVSATSTGNNVGASGIIAAYITVDNGSTVEATANAAYEARAIYADTDLTVEASSLTVTATGSTACGICVLDGSTKITNSTVAATATADTDSGLAFAIYSYGDYGVVIGDSSVVTANASGYYPFAILSFSDATISSSTITAEAVSDSTNAYAETSAICSYGNLKIDNGSSINATASAASSYGVSVAISGNYSVTIDGSSVTVKSDCYSALGIGSSNIVITDSEISSEASGTGAYTIYASEGVTIENNSIVSVTADGDIEAIGVYSHSGTVTIDSSDVSATAKGDEAYAVYSYGDLTIKEDSTVTAAITSTGTDSCAICTESNMTISASEVEASGGVEVGGEATLDTAASCYEVRAGSSASALEEIEQVDASTLETIYQNLIASYSYVNVTAGNHLHTYGNPTYTWSDDYSTVTGVFTCTESGCTSTVTLTAASTTSKVLGQTVYEATFTIGSQTFTATKTAGTSLLNVQANYAAVTAAIAKANALNPGDYVDFSGVTAAINAVNWNLNVLNQTTVNAYAEAIETAIANLVPVDVEEVEVDEPVEAGNTETEID